MSFFNRRTGNVRNEDSRPRPAELKLGPYVSSREHCEDELRRVAQLLFAYVQRWRADVLGSSEPENWAHVNRDAISQEQVDTLLREQHDLFAPPTSWAKASIAERIEAAETMEQRIDARRMDPASTTDLRLIHLVARFGLTRIQADVILLSLLVETDIRFQRVCANLQSETKGILPSIHLTNSVLESAHPEFRDGRPDVYLALLGNHLITLHGTGGPNSLIQLEPAVLHYLLGIDALDLRLGGIAENLEPLRHDLILEPDLHTRLQKLQVWWDGLYRQQREQSAERARRWRQEEWRRLSQNVADHRKQVSIPNITLLLHGAYGSGRRKIAEHFCAVAETPLFLVQVDRALSSPHGWETIVDVIYRDARLREAAIYWAGCEILHTSNEGRVVQQWDYLVTAAENYPYLTFLASEVTWQPVGRFQRTAARDPLFLRIDLPQPSYGIRVILWIRALDALMTDRLSTFEATPEAIHTLAGSLANSFQFTSGQLADAVRAAQSIAIERDPVEPIIQEKDLFDGCRRQTGRRLISFARQIKPRADLKLDQLILPDNTKQQLVELQVRMQSLQRIYSLYQLEDRLTRGMGVVGLFTGSSGTGKTTAAECLAGEMHVDLFKVDAASVVSKYVGETEKHLDQVFREAEAANGILFFDEADALFGKRGEVKEAQDRWANLEVNYLLQRIEDYAGVVILATNLSQNIDEAFRRRIHVIVDFPFPNETDRLRIWQQIFAGVANELSLEQLAQVARFRLSGGNINNIARDAIFRANPVHHEADTPERVTLTHVVLSLAREYQKLGKPITPNEFGTEFFTWIQEHNIL